MVSDRALQQDVLDELEFEPSIDAAHIGVVVMDGVVTLSGFVGSLAEKISAERAAGRVKGVRAIAQEIEVLLPAGKRETDDDIARRILEFFNWDTLVPKDRMKVKVEKGVVTLSGIVDWQYQRSEAELDARKIAGVNAVINEVEIRPPVNDANVKEQIRRALQRSAEIEAGNIEVEVHGDKVSLMGHVHGRHEREVAERAAWSAKGVAEVDDQISVIGSSRDEDR